MKVIYLYFNKYIHIYFFNLISLSINQFLNLILIDFIVFFYNTSTLYKITYYIIMI